MKWSIYEMTFALVFLLSSCVQQILAPEVKSAKMPRKEQLIGDWEKTTISLCSQAYPDRIRFQPNGLYFGQKDPPGTFSVWDVGKYMVINEKQVSISTANDANVTYESSIFDDVLTFIDPESCEFQYRRVRS
jgi:hypothetical protein